MRPSRPPRPPRPAPAPGAGAEVVLFAGNGATEADYAALAATVEEVAVQRVEAQRKVRDGLLARLEAGDVAGAVAILRRWTVDPVVTIAAEI